MFTQGSKVVPRQFEAQYDPEYDDTRFLRAALEVRENPWVTRIQPGDYYAISACRADLTDYYNIAIFSVCHHQGRQDLRDCRVHPDDQFATEDNEFLQRFGPAVVEVVPTIDPDPDYGSRWVALNYAVMEP